MGAAADPGARRLSGADAGRVDRSGGHRTAECGQAAGLAARSRPQGGGHEGDVRSLRAHGSTSRRALPRRALLWLVLGPDALPPVRALRAGRPDRHPPRGRSDLPALLPQRSAGRHGVRGVSPDAASGVQVRGRDGAVLQLRAEDQAEVCRLRASTQGQRPDPGGSGLRRLLRGSETPVRCVRRGRADSGACRRRSAGGLHPLLPRSEGRVQRLRPVAPRRAGQSAGRSFPLPFLLAASRPYLRVVRQRPAHQDHLASWTRLLGLLPDPACDACSLLLMW